MDQGSVLLPGKRVGDVFALREGSGEMTGMRPTPHDLDSVTEDAITHGAPIPPMDLPQDQRRAFLGGVFSSQCDEMFARAEMRWMSVEDAEITVPARTLALLGRQCQAAREALAFYADEDNWTQMASWGSRIHDDESKAIQDGGKTAREAFDA